MENLDLELGRLEFERGKRQIIVSAPHGIYELRTEGIVREIAGKLSASHVVARGFRRRSHPVNVNRPTEGIGLPSVYENETHRAREVFEKYLQILKDFQNGNNATLLVEIHGNSLKMLSHTIEIATKGFTTGFLKEIKEINSRRLKALFPGKPYRLKIEPIDSIIMVAGGAKRIGSIREFQMALHIELPRDLRVNDEYRRRIESLLARMIDEIDLHLMKKKGISQEAH